MARYSGTQVNPRGGGQPSTTLTTVCYSTNIYIFTLTRRHTHTRDVNPRHTNEDKPIDRTNNQSGEYAKYLYD